MTTGDGQETFNLPSELDSIGEGEFSSHSDFVIRNIEMVIDILAGEQLAKQTRLPAACPQSTPVCLSRRRSAEGVDQKFPCLYNRVKTIHREGESCRCGDPLYSTDSPLDAVAAIAIAEDDLPVEQRYFDHHWRNLVADLREECDSWDDIERIPFSGIHALMEKYSDGRGIDSDRVQRLTRFLSSVKEYGRTSGVSLTGLPRLSYEQLADELSSFPGISSDDAWWLLLTVFEKPVFPASREIDRALACLGLLRPGDTNSGTNRRKGVEDALPDRLLPSFHRALAGHQLVCSHDLFEEDCDARKFTLPYRQRCQATTSDTQPVAVDLFSGAGGLSLGFDRAGFAVKYATDLDQSATDTYRFNHPEIPHRHVVQGDITELVDGGAFEDLEYDVDLVIGGPPCQAISTAGYRSRRSEDDEYSVLDDSRNQLYKEYIRAIRTLEPDVILMENVEALTSEIGDSDTRISKLVLQSLDEVGYDAELRSVDCSRFGIPQERHRVFIIGTSRENHASTVDISGLFDKIFDESPGDGYTLRQGLSGLPRICRGEGGRVVVGKSPGPLGEYMRINDLNNSSRLVFNHKAREHPKPKDKKLFDEALSPGETSWDVIQDPDYEDLVEYDLGTEENPRFTDKYRMLDWESKAPTVVAHLEKDANNFIIPDYHGYYSDTTTEPDNLRNRGITPREAARLQSFPDDFVFLGSFTEWFVQIGNAVPPVAAERIGNVLRRVVFSEHPLPDLDIQNPRTARSDD